MVWFRKTFGRTRTGRRYETHTGTYGKAVIQIDSSDPSIASFMTPSLKEILKLFNEDIIFLRAGGERNINKKNVGLSHLGLTLNNKSNNCCEMLYKRRYSDKRKHDKLTHKNLEKILDLLEAHAIPDCAVTEVTIKFKSKELKELLLKDFGFLIRGDTFLAHFIMHPCENDSEREMWERDYKINQELLDQGFKHSVLHCVGLIDDNQIRTIPKKRRRHYIFWIKRNKDLKKQTEYHSHPDIALEVKDSLNKDKSEKYIVKKNYRSGKETGLILDSIEK